MLSGKKILIGITGCIAAYKILELIRLYKRANAEVKVVLTPNALNFVTRLTIQTLCQNEVFVEMFDSHNWKPEHISLTNADIFVIAPCSANTLAKIEKGFADNLLTSTALAFSKPIIIAPSMNNGMWDNPIVQKNIQNLKDIGYTIVDPEEGFLACGTTGKGRLTNIKTIFNKTIEILNPSKINLKKKKIVVTAGGTKEKIDPVRYITNNSSGKMGEAIADFANQIGADVTLITTKKLNKPYNIIYTESADEMFEAVKNIDFDTIFMAAAVSDFKIKNLYTNKIKKNNNDSLTIELVQNPDLLKFLVENKKENQTIVGFCAESENLIQNAEEKIKNKKCDFLIANDISRTDIGFDSDENEIIILDKDLNKTYFEKTSKTELAKKIIEFIYGTN